jgi:Tfp pilus assembly protein PilV
MKRISEKGVSIIEALVSTAIIGIGFVAIFQMVQYSVRSIDVSGERTKATYLTGMIAEDLYADKNQEKGGIKFMDQIASTPWNLTKCNNSGTSAIPHADFSDNNAHDNKTKKWGSRLSKDYIKCRPDSSTSATGTTKDEKKLNIFKICHSGCTVTLKDAHDTIYMGRSEVNMLGGNKTKILYFQLK